MTVGKVSYSTESVTLVFTISDTGQGMTPAQIAGLFEEFSRFNAIANREIEGAGLGMSIVQTLLDKMNGKISVESEPGMGSIFTVRIPQRIADKNPIGNEAAKKLNELNFIENKKVVQSEWEPMPYGKVLVVDDTSLNLYVAKGLLEPYELQVDTADSGFGAIEKVKSGMAYDVIFLDHMMPQMDGIETVRRLRQMGYAAPIIAFTANAIVGQEENFIEQGFNDFISKPIQTAALNQILNRYVRDSREQMKVNHVINIAKTQIDHAELCREFAKSQKDVIHKIKRATKSNDYKTAQLLAHTLRSLAGLIGEAKLMDLSGKAESAFRKERMPIDVLNNLSAEVERVLSKISLLSEEKAKIPTPSKEKQKEIFASLETLLSQNNAEVINLLPTLSAIPNTEEIVSHIENYNFSLAMNSLERFKKTNM
jgi:CheY-like chemotaxis protein